MTKQKIQKMIAVLCIAAAAVCLVLGLVNVPKQNGAARKRRNRPRKPAAAWQPSVRR